ncbi:type II toxin-antitoxin system RelE/ParE family toxin [Phenylobacterium montanum]|uniref:Type II toxin-antitoxin system RelE/ParE family toxin n=1 Tax=Phenylobacterium montanum TaxID=2823693 RepID=A0A975G341_9CAUL|nr:type II toxin-antitoxin system RelE/ParE family toxin [Caulobacter sp. S6]QUD89914.1 type II toxin-antitoxin system RelE/ParE family toxin [Caulobacter sp. S6]
MQRLADFLAQGSERAARRASEALGNAVLSLGELPERGRPGVRQGWRELVIPFGAAAYVVQYRVEADSVFVARIFHSREAR